MSAPDRLAPPSCVHVWNLPPILPSATSKNANIHAKARSWVESANRSGSDCPIQKLPYAFFRRRQSAEAWRGGIAIGDEPSARKGAANAGPWSPAGEGDRVGMRLRGSGPPDASHSRTAGPDASVPERQQLPLAAAYRSSPLHARLLRKLRKAQSTRNFVTPVPFDSEVRVGRARQATHKLRKTPGLPSHDPLKQAHWFVQDCSRRRF
jgi:hypothetical protein